MEGQVYASICVATQGVSHRGSSHAGRKANHLQGKGEGVKGFGLSDDLATEFALMRI